MIDYFYLFIIVNTKMPYTQRHGLDSAARRYTENNGAIVKAQTFETDNPVPGDKIVTHIDTNVVFIVTLSNSEKTAIEELKGNERVSPLIL